MGQRRLQQRLTDEVVGQQPRPEFLSHSLGPRAAESIEPHRGLYVAQFELYHPASAIKRRDLGASIDLVIEQRSHHDE